MAIIDLGKVSITWRGTYAGGTAYTPKDAVVYNNASYICIANTTGNLPTDTTYWNVMAAKGVDGTDVGTTITTQGDILYRDASGPARLGAGTSGQFLKTQGTGANPVWSTVSQLVKGIASQANSKNSEVIVTSTSSYTNTDICGGNLVYTPASNSSKIMIALSAGMQDVTKAGGTGYGLALNITQTSGLAYSDHKKTHYGFYALSGLNVNYGQSITDIWVLNNTTTNPMTITGKGYAYSEGNTCTVRFREGTIQLIEF